MWLLIAAGALFILALGVTFFAYHTAFYSRPRRDDDPYALPKGEQYEAAADKMRALIAELERRPFEPVGIRAFDGVELYARYYHARDGAPLQIQFHGYRGNALRDFCGGHRLALESGHNVLLIDERANGASAVEAVKHTDIPILLLHGEDDRFVPCSMSREIHAAGRTTRLVTFPGAGHGLSYIADEARYSAEVEDFIGTCIGRYGSVRADSFSTEG